MTKTKVLCIGDFKGKEAKRFRKKGCLAWSIDLNPDFENEFIYKMSAENLDFKDNFFDIVYMSHVIEHIPVTELRKVAEEIERVCKIGGSIEIVTPVFNNMIWDDPTHIRPHNKWSIQSLFRNCKMIKNFKEVRIKHLWGLKRMNELIVVLEKSKNVLCK